MYTHGYDCVISQPLSLMKLLKITESWVKISLANIYKHALHLAAGDSEVIALLLVVVVKFYFFSVGCFHFLSFISAVVFFVFFM